MPYTFKIEFSIGTVGNDGEEIVINKLTGEELSIKKKNTVNLLLSEEERCIVIKKCVSKRKSKN